MSFAVPEALFLTGIDWVAETCAACVYAMKTWLDGEVLAGAKSDPGDAAVTAEYLRLRRHMRAPAAKRSPKHCATPCSRRSACSQP